MTPVCWRSKTRSINSGNESLTGSSVVNVFSLNFPSGNVWQWNIRWNLEKWFSLAKWRFPKMGGTSKSSSYRWMFHYKPSNFEVHLWKPPSPHVDHVFFVPQHIPSNILLGPGMSWVPWVQGRARGRCWPWAPAWKPKGFLEDHPVNRWSNSNG